MELDTGAYDQYIASLFAPQDTYLTETLQEMERENLRSINVSPVEGKLLQILALSVKAKRILEIGTLGGYSGLHFARALPEDGKLITLELDPHHAAVARRNFDRADLGHKVDIRVGPASETLEKLIAAKVAPFDVIFIDANKGGYPEYLRQSLPLLREGGLLLADNTLREALNTEKEKGTNRYNAIVAEHPELTTTIIPVLRPSGLDGLTVSFKGSPANGK
jgi:caffeoyl-CoA O-methyltransferase